MKIGIYQSYWGRVGGGQRYIGVVAEVLARSHQVEIVHHEQGFDPVQVQEPLELDLARVGFRYMPRAERPVCSTANPLVRLRQERDWCRELSDPYDLFIDNSDLPPFFCHAPRGVLFIHFPGITYGGYHGHLSPEWMSRPGWKRCLTRLYHRVEWRQRFGSYDLYFVNSAYGQGWLRSLWGLKAGIVYPPLRDGFCPGEKQNLILSIGAFHHFQHKKHGVLIECFRQLCDEGLNGWRYVLVGASGSATEDQVYLDGLRTAAEGYPIEIRPDVSGAELKSLLERSAMLWHSMGFGVDPVREPERFEHFGMVATEAMAAGCVPVVFNGGGLREIVTHGVNGMLWATLEELKQATRRVADQPQRRAELAEAALRRAGDFSNDQFESRLLEALAPVLRS